MLNRVALITGVGPGLGAALARRFAREGFQVGLLARSPDFIHPLAKEISASGPRAISVVADVSRPVEASAAVQRVRNEWCVFLPKDASTFEIRKIGRGRDLGDEVEVLSGLKTGEKIVVEGAFLLKSQAEKGEADHHD